MKTPVKDQDSKLDIIEHLNQDHQDEILAITQLHIDANTTKALIKNIYQEGGEITYIVDNQEKQGYIEFPFSGEAEETILYLAYDAMLKQGKALDKSNKHYFEVVDTSFITDNIIRLTLKSSQPILQDYAGYSFQFALQKLKKLPKPTNKTQKDHKLSFFNKIFYQFLLWLYTKLNSDKRKKMMASFSKNLRFYTARKIMGDNNDIVWVDIYTHNESAGSLWANSLKKGDIIKSVRDHKEKTSNLDSGKVLFIADETSIPTIIAVLEKWNNPIAPIIINLSYYQCEQNYLNKNDCPEGTQIIRLIGEYEQELLKTLETLKEIDIVFGGVENKLNQKVKKYFREHQSNIKQNRLKGYWKKS